MVEESFHHTCGWGAKSSHCYRDVALAFNLPLREDFRGWGAHQRSAALANSPPLLGHNPLSWAHAQPYGREAGGGLVWQRGWSSFQASTIRRLCWSKKSRTIGVCGWSAGQRIAVRLYPKITPLAKLSCLTAAKEDGSPCISSDVIYLSLFQLFCSRTLLLTPDLLLPGHFFTNFVRTDCGERKILLVFCFVLFFLQPEQNDAWDSYCADKQLQIYLASQLVGGWVMRTGGG